MDFQLKNKTIFIAGSSQGIGKATAEAFLKEGARVVITGRSTENLEKIEKPLSDIYSKEKMMFIKGDFSKSNTIEKALHQITKRWKTIDCIIANIGNGKGKLGWYEEEKEWQCIFDTNFFSAVRLVQSTVPFFLRQKCGSILFISSIAGCERLKAPLAYSSAKSALLSYANNLSQELASSNIRVNVLAPGNIIFPGSSWEKKLLADKKKITSFLKTEVPMQRFGVPEEIADAAVFLSSNKASFATGACFVIDGGQTRSI